MIITYNRVGTDHLLLSMEEYKKIDAYIAKTGRTKEQMSLMEAMAVINDIPWPPPDIKIQQP